jgi:hypothetical protein
VKSFFYLYLIVLFLSTAVDREFSSVDSFRTKSHREIKGLEKIYIRPLTELQQCEYDAGSKRFLGLKGNAPQEICSVY